MPKTKQVETALTETSFIKDKLTELSKMKKELGTNEKQVTFVRNMINPDLTDVELMVFLTFSNKLQLNPFLQEIIPIVYKGKERRVSYIITRTGKRVVAGRTGQLQGITTETTYTAGGEQVPAYAEGARLFSAKATVVRNGINFTAEVLNSEYNTGYNVWKTKPDTMLRKVAESQALSSAFPEILGSTYDEAEAESMTNGHNKVIEVPDDKEPATQEQRDTLKEMGIDVGDRTISRGYAVQLMTDAKKRKEDKEYMAKLKEKKEGKNGEK